MVCTLLDVGNGCTHLEWDVAAGADDPIDLAPASTWSREENSCAPHTQH